jgi:hypothetical protein
MAQVVGARALRNVCTSWSRAVAQVRGALHNHPLHWAQPKPFLAAVRWHIIACCL